MEVDEAGLGDLDSGQMRHVGGLERGGDPLRDLEADSRRPTFWSAAPPAVAQSP